MPKTVDKFIIERQDIIDKLSVILGFNDNNNMFSLHKLDNDIVKQNDIIALESDIKKYFICSNWTCFKNKNNIKRKWLSLIKYIFKNMNYNVSSSQLISNSNNIMKYKDTIYEISIII